MQTEAQYENAAPGSGSTLMFAPIGVNLETTGGNGILLKIICAAFVLWQEDLLDSPAADRFIACFCYSGNQNTV